MRVGQSHCIEFSFKLDELCCVPCFCGAHSVERYLFTVFFKVLCILSTQAAAYLFEFHSHLLTRGSVIPVFWKTGVALVIWKCATVYIPPS